MLIPLHHTPVAGVVVQRKPASNGRAVVAGMLVLHGIELMLLVKAAAVTGRFARAHQAHGAGLPSQCVAR
jgi:hypothetical protein